jgi:hypothetical protein
MSLAGKKVLTFAGRSHHVQRLDGIMQALTSAGAEALYFTADNAVQIDPNSLHLIQSGKKFLDALDYYPSGASGSVAAWASHILGTIKGDWQASIQTYVDPFWMAFSVHEFCECLLSFDQMFEKEKPDLVMILLATV